MTYYYRVRGTNGSSFGAYSDVVSEVAPEFGWKFAQADGEAYDLGSAAVGNTVDISALWQNTPTAAPQFTLAGSGVTVDPDTGAVTATAEGTHDFEIDLVDANANSAEADWIARSTAPGVVWAHKFDSSSEATAFTTTVLPTDNAYNGIVPLVVEDPQMGSCLEHRTMGAMLTAPFTSGGSQMTIDDRTYWPDPAVLGNPYYFWITQPYPNHSATKNVFRVTALTPQGAGAVLTVQWRSEQGSFDSCNPVQQSYSVGAYLGNHSANWVRPFTALIAGENGLAVNDRAAATSTSPVPLRSKNTDNATYGVPMSGGLLEHGYYGHQSNITRWRNWTGWYSQSSLLIPRGPESPYASTHLQGSSARFNLWDGDEFYVQMRVKVDPRYAEYRNPDGDGADWGGGGMWNSKGYGFQTEQSAYHQLVVGYSVGDRFSIPSTPDRAMWALACHKAQKIVGANDYARPRDSAQAGSLWDVSPYYASRSTGFLPGTGCNTPDGVAGWEMPPGEWVTFLFHVKPGRSYVADSTVEVWYARTFHPQYNGTWSSGAAANKILSVTDFRNIYSNSDDGPYPDGAIQFGSPSWDEGGATGAMNEMDVLPGYSAMTLFRYLNYDLGAAKIHPKSYYLRYAQIIFSKQPIAAPPAGA